MPHIDSDAEKARHHHSEPVSEDDIQQSIERGIQLLEPLSKSCLYYHHVRQFHIDQSAQGESATTQSNVPSYLLGIYSEPAESGSPSEQTDVSQRVESPVTSLRRVGDKRYLVQKWTGGTKCDLTGKPRTVEVQANDRISWFHEVTICQYQIVISTPRLCDEMVLASQTQSKAHTIECNPVVPEHLIASGSEEQTEKTASQAEVPTDPTAQNQNQVPTHSSTTINRDSLVAAEESKHEQLDELDIKEIKKAAESEENVEPVTKDLLLTMIAQLTSQVNQLQRQAQESEAEDGMDITFIYTDEQGRILQGDSAQIKKLFASQLKHTNEEKRTSGNGQVADGSEVQQQNKKAYEKTYYTT
ncbi:Protein OS-9 [Apophysomyces ossiformis]|uniref:Protein OS-9 homolog n=1 Tax=Apophysomyces ossiformis TaxID=679940 RepID=A0A8H7ESE1_9FUNG|nr:Protein OS-9 [Apophysomyces ossiformis]